MLDPITRLRDARFDGPQALYTEAVRMLSERPALPDDLAGLVDQLRQVGKRCNGFPNWADDAAAIARAELAEATLAIAEEALRGAIAAIDAAYDGPGDNGAYTVRERAALAKIEALKGGA